MINKEIYAMMAASAYDERRSLDDGIAAHSFQVQDLEAEHKTLSQRGVEFVTEPMDAGPVHMAVFDDTCGNLIQLIQMKNG